MQQILNWLSVESLTVALSGVVFTGAVALWLFWWNPKDAFEKQILLSEARNWVYQLWVRLRQPDQKFN